MPKASKEHSYDRIATDALRQIFPKNWRFIDPRDVDGGREYGQDLIIELVDENNKVTGLEFTIQNKVNPILRKGFVGVSIEIETLNYLIGLPRHVLLHAYHKATSTSYWLWLNEWYVEQYDRKWEKQETVTIRIPQANVLDRNFVESIGPKLSLDQHLQSRRRIAEQISKGPDWAVRVELNRDKKSEALEISSHSASQRDRPSVTTVISAKHEGATPRIIPLDADTEEALSRVIETGIPAEIRGNLVIENVPEIFKIETTEQDTIVILPSKVDEPMALRIEFLDAGGQIVFRSPYVTMSLIQPGTRVARWQGYSEDGIVKYTMSADKNTDLFEFEFKFDLREENAVKLKGVFDSYERVLQAKGVRFTNLRTDATAFLDDSKRAPIQRSIENQRRQRLANVLATIELEAGVKIPVPQIIDNSSVFWAEFVADVLTKGSAKLDQEDAPKDNLLCGSTTISQAREFISRYENNGSRDIRSIETQKIIVNVLGEKLDLGHARYVFEVTELEKVEELKKAVAAAGLHDDELTSLCFKFDHEKVYLEFIEWPRQSS